MARSGRGMARRAYGRTHQMHPHRRGMGLLMVVWRRHYQGNHRTEQYFESSRNEDCRTQTEFTPPRRA